MLSDVLLSITLAVVVLVSANILSIMDEQREQLRRVERLLLEVWNELDIRDARETDEAQQREIDEELMKIARRRGADA